ncbi:autotransporter serine protease [Herbaspirillum sp. RV1423]|uniref:autotransporter serine protease n=1 Tax=Herbaspirillum sp. RV1423 TaxID=1443993 RepID=UPI001E40254A|nr:autotransporter serine protease [Herbaspirillum sp. RV1423]
MQNPGGTSPSPVGFLNPSDPANAANAHARGITGAGVTVGVVDTDFDVSAPELAGRITKSVYTTSTTSGFLGGNGTGDPHGTEVAEALGGTNTGVAPAVQIQGIAADTNTGLIALNTSIYNRLFNNGIRIFNQSLQTGSIAAPVNAVTYYNIYQSFVAGGGLFIWATGNQSSTQPSLTAGLPALYPDLQKGWIAVTAVNAAGGAEGYSSADTTPGVISSYANRCGVAANWCLAAPGDFVSPTAGRRVYGTSFAAPAVTGAVALVQQVYPWMNADLLRQTILSTATSMNDTATYGWGLLNASKAVNGPALFSQSLALGSNVNVNFDTVSSTFSNAIAGDAGLIKSGTGTLTLSGTNTYTGSSEISNGTLNITGSVASSVQIDSGGNLAGGGGRVGSNVTNNGRLSNTGAGMTISGNYTASSSAVLANDINSTLTVGGTASLGGSHLVATVPAGNPDATAYVTAQSSNVPKKLLTAGAAVVNTFGDLSFQTVGTAFPPLLTANLTYFAREVDLTIGRVSTSVAAQAFSSDASRTNSAANVEQAMMAADAMVATGQTGSANTAFLTSVAALQRVPTVAALGDALDSLSGQIHASAQAMSFQQSQAVNRDLSNRLWQFGQQNQQIRTGLWASALGASGKLAESGYAGANTATEGGQFGVDTRLNDKAIIGVALSYSHGQADFDRFGGTFKSRNTGISVYGRYDFSDAGTDDWLKPGAYLSGRAGIATVSSTVRRTAMAGAEIENLQADHTDRMFSAYTEAGYTLALPGRAVVLTPFVQISYDGLKRGGFSETGGSFGLRADSQSYHQTAGLLGVRGNTSFNWSAGKSIVSAYASWQHAASRGNLDFRAAFSGVPGSSFTVQGVGLPRNSGWTGIGISTEINRKWSWYANYDGQFANGNQVNHVVVVGLRISLD